jgi:hypothetical protein
MYEPLTDWNDAIVQGINAREIADAAWARPVPELASRASLNSRDHVVTAADGKWPEPKPLPSGLASVEPFNSEFLPAAVAPWVSDIANRLQCPPDYVAVRRNHGAWFRHRSPNWDQTAAENRLDRNPEPVGLVHRSTRHAEVTGNDGGA